MLYHQGHIVAFVGTGGSLAAENSIGKWTGEVAKRYMSKVSLTRANMEGRYGKPTMGVHVQGADAQIKCYPREWNYVAFVRDGKCTG